MRAKIAARSSSLILKSYAKVLKPNVIIEAIENSLAMLIKYCIRMGSYVI